MAKFLNKKERVYDIKLTNYAKYLLSVGKYKPTFYAFFDDNVLYDVKYRRGSLQSAGGTALRPDDSRTPESQNNVSIRVKDNTPYIESLTVFKDISSEQQEIVNRDGDEAALMRNPELESMYRYARETAEEMFGKTQQVMRMFSQHYYASDVTPKQYVPKQSVFRYENAIGDALLDSEYTDVAPAWKIVVLNGTISSSAQQYKITGSVSSSIPQVNIEVQYKKEIRHKNNPTRLTDQVEIGSVRSSYNSTPPFSDDRFIRLSAQDPIIYVDEVNTELLTENFDVEVFLVTGSVGEVLERKYFVSKNPQIVDGLMTREQPSAAGRYTYAADAAQTEAERMAATSNVTDKAVEYYFDVVTDSHTDRNIVCKQLQIYNKTSYYIDIDLDCGDDEMPDIYNDIYGSEVEPEICLD